MAATFKKFLKTTDEKLGSKIISGLASTNYADVFDGEIKVLPAIDTTNGVSLSTGQIPIGSTYASCIGFLEFPTIPAPSFGSADLIDVNLHLFSKDMNYNYDYIYPDYEVYKMKFPLPLNEFGNLGEFMALKDADIFIGSGRFGSSNLISEVFNGTDDSAASSPSFPSLLSQGGVSNALAKDLYMTIEDAWMVDEASAALGDGNDASNCPKRETYFTRYGQTHPVYGQIVKFRVRSSNVNEIKASKGKYTLYDTKDDPVYYRRHWDYSYCLEINNFEENKGNYIKDLNSGAIVGNSEDFDVDILEISRARMSKTNTFFDGVYSTENRLDQVNVDTDGQPLIIGISQPFFTTAGGPTNGQAGKLQTYHASLDGINHPGTFSFRDEEQAHQTVMVMKELPKPLASARQYGTEEDMGNMIIDIRFQIEELAKYCKTTIIGGDTTRKYWKSADEDGDGGNVPDGMDNHISSNTMGRSVVFMLASRVPWAGETFGEYIHRMNTGYMVPTAPAGGTVSAPLPAQRTPSELIKFPTNDKGNALLPDGTVEKSWIWKEYPNFKSDFFNHANNKLQFDYPHNNYNGVAFMRIPTFSATENDKAAADRTDGRNADDINNGEVFLFHTGVEAGTVLSYGDKVNWWDGYSHVEDRDSPWGQHDIIPFVCKEGARGRIGDQYMGTNTDSAVNGNMPAKESYTELRNVAEGVEGFNTGEWYTLRIVMNTTHTETHNQEVGTVSWYVLDEAKNIVGKVERQVHSGGYRWPSGDNMTKHIPGGNNEAGFPHVLTIWVNNVPIGISARHSYGHAPRACEPIGGDSFMSDYGISQVSLSLDSITVDGHSLDVDNATISPENNERRTVKIGTGKASGDLISVKQSESSPVGGDIISFLEDDDNMIPSYLTWGIKAIRDFNGMWEDYASSNEPGENTPDSLLHEGNTQQHFFMGGYKCISPDRNDINDATKRMQWYTTGNHNNGSDMLFFYPHVEQRLGMWLTDERLPGLISATSQVNEAPFLNDLVKLEGFENSIDRFSKKGFLTISNLHGRASPDSELVNTAPWYPRESPIFSCKIKKIVDANAGLIEIKNADLLKAFEDSEMIIYRAGYNVTEAEWKAETGTAAASIYIRRRVQIDSNYGIHNNIVKLIRTADCPSSSRGSVMYPKYADNEYVRASSGRPMKPGIILQQRFLSELYISPLRYWLTAEVYNRAESTNDALPEKSYDHSLYVSNEITPALLSRGMTLNETEYSDASVYSNRWSLSFDEDNTVIELDTDYGFGTAGSRDVTSRDFEVSTGYISKFVPKNNQFNIAKLKGLVNQERDRLIRPEERITLAITNSPESSGSGTIISSKYHHENRQRHPYISYIFKDEVPVIESFVVKPDESGFYPKFEWEVDADDAWYGFIILDNEYIEHQYNRAALHLPFNESNLDRTYETIDFSIGGQTKGYKYDANNDGTQINAFRSPASGEQSDGKALGSRGVMTSEEGLAGNCLLFHGITDDKEFTDTFGTDSDGLKTLSNYTATGGDITSRGSMYNINQLIEFEASDFTQPTDELSIIAHFTVDSLGASAVILEKGLGYKIWVDASGFVNASVNYDASNLVTLKSTSVVPVGENIPTCVMLVVEAALFAGNVKLFINSRLEDQTGKKTTNGDTNHWKIGNNIYTASGTPSRRNNLRIGASKDHANLSYAHYGISGNITQPFKGKIEEIVIYNKVIYPVVPKNGSAVLHKPVQELSNSSIASGQPITAKLFIKDYHNIRGKVDDDVASSSIITIQKGGLGLKTD